MVVTASLPEVRARSGAARILLAIVVLVLIAIVCFAAWAWWTARANLPQLDGAIAVPGLSSQVRVVRDEQGVPTIEAATLEDLFFAQGYVTAQDRLWQMDIMRRAAAGELSEVVGEATLKIDRQQRILGLRSVAEAAAKKIEGRDRAYLEAYARGVNAFIDSHPDRMPMEFRLLCASSNALYLLHCPAAEAARYRIRPWSITDSFLIGANMVQELNHYGYARALTREKILAKIGPELTADLYANSSWRDRPPTDFRGMDEQSAASGDADDDDDDDDDVDPEGAPTNITSIEPLFNPAQLSPSDLSETETFRPGSNDWVVSGQHTVTGKPLLSNDMHLDHQMPNLWFEAHLKKRQFRRGGSHAAGRSVCDCRPQPAHRLGIHQRGADGRGRFHRGVQRIRDNTKLPRDGLNPQHRQETIHVKGKPDVTLDVVTTRHGPIITELIPGETRRIALRWTLHDGMGLHVLRCQFRATTGMSFRAAFSKLSPPRAKCRVRRCGWPHRLSGNGSRADPRRGRWQFAGERERRCARMERLYSLRRHAACLRSARWEFLRPPMGGSLPTATSIRSARNGKRRGGRTASIACSNRERSFRPRICWRCRWMCRRLTTVLRRQVCVCARSCANAVGPREAGSGHFARLGWADVGRLRRRRRSRPKLGRNWCVCCWSRSWVGRGRFSKAPSASPGPADVKETGS